MKCKICNLEIPEDFKCKIPKYDENGKPTLFDYAHPGCWKVWYQQGYNIEYMSIDELEDWEK